MRRMVVFWNAGLEVALSILSPYGILSDTLGGRSARAWIVLPRDFPSNPNLSLALISHRTTPGLPRGIANVKALPSAGFNGVPLPSTIAFTILTGRLSSAVIVTVEPTSALGA